MLFLTLFYFKNWENKNVKNVTRKKRINVVASTEKSGDAIPHPHYIPGNHVPNFSKIGKLVSKLLEQFPIPAPTAILDLN